MARDFRSDGVPLIRLAGLRHQGSLLAGCNHLDPDMVASRWGHFRLRVGDVLLSTSASLGEVAVVDPPGAGSIPYTGIISFRTRNDRVRADFVRHALTAPSFARQIEAMGAGSVLRHFGPMHLRQMTVDIPPRSVQRAIAEVLGALDDKIEANRSVTSIGTSLMAERFSSLMHPGLSNVRDGEPLLSGWRRNALETMLTVLETGKRPRGGVGSYSAGVPSLGAESVLGLAIYDYAKTKYVPVDFFRAMRRGIVEDRDVLLYKDGGRPGEFEPHVSMLGTGFPFNDFCINEHVYRLRAKRPLTQEYLYFWLSSPPILEAMRRSGTGVAIPGLNSTAVKTLPIIVPPFDVVEQFTSVAEPLVLSVLATARETRSLATLRDTLLPKLLSGELRVRDAETVVGEAV